MIATPSFESPLASELTEFLQSMWARGYRYLDCVRLLYHS